MLTLMMRAAPHSLDPDPLLPPHYSHPAQLAHPPSENKPRHQCISHPALGARVRFVGMEH